MQDLSLHVLDVIENSVRAGCKNLWIKIEVDVLKNKLQICVKDDGSGMSDDLILEAQNPFFTTKSKRKKKVGLGIPLFKQNAEVCDGKLTIKSEINKGTELVAFFSYNHIDRMPIGKIGDTFLGSIIGHTEVDFHIELIRKENSSKKEFILDTCDIKKELGDVPINYPDVITFIDEMIKEGIKNTYMEEV